MAQNWWVLPNQIDFFVKAAKPFCFGNFAMRFALCAMRSSC
jgi:hypothetical protein